VIGDGHLGIWAGLRNVYPDAQEQRCWNHRILNALDKVPKTRQAHARLLLTQIPYAQTQEDAEQLKAGYQHWCRQKGLEEAATGLDRPS
jgi:transposase-like protein